MMNATLPASFQRASRNGAIVGLLATVLCVFGAISNRPQFFKSWLAAWLFFAGVSFGALVIVMMQSLTGGAWGVAIRRLSEAAMMNLPLMALLFVPVLAGAYDLYPWLRADALAAHPKWQHKLGYLNLPFFTLRAIFYLVLLSALAFSIRRWSIREDKSRNSALPSKQIRKWSAAGLVVYVLCMNFASTDWVMSLEPDWHSTIFVVILMAGQFLSALALMTALLALFAGREPFATLITARHFHDLGNLLLTFVIFWTYVSFSQFLIIWSGNLPKEISWYLHRSAGGWQWIALSLMVFQFLLPVALLLLRETKRKRERLATIALMVVIANIVNVYWLVAPAFYPGGVQIYWLDLAALAAVGGLWTALFLWFLNRQPLLPLHPEEAMRDE